MRFPSDELSKLLIEFEKLLVELSKLEGDKSNGSVVSLISAMGKSASAELQMRVAASTNRHSSFDKPI
jgi:hypothetical protein